MKNPSPQKSSEAGTYTTTTEDFYSQGLRTAGTSSYINTPRATNASLSYDTDSSTNGYRGNNKSNYQHTHNHNGGYAYDQDPSNGYFDPGNGQDHGFFGNDNGYVEEYDQPRKLKKISRRTVNLGNLDKATTHGDVTAVVVGGPILDVFLRTHDRIASVSFVDEEDANSFYQYAKRNDIYIRGKRVRFHLHIYPIVLLLTTIAFQVQVFWAERHFTLPNHVANKINIGATRNLIVHNATTRHTEASIREDLDHIHNCVVISIKFVNGNAKIETNSVHNAMFARTCMMSRAKYKGSKIEWDVDECAVPCPEKKVSSQPSQKVNVKEEVPTNRFAALDIDAEYDTETGMQKGKMNVTAKAVEIR